ncbi:NADH-quinone oxidoreductase subunit NuoH [Granulicoccus sp. GXG6511]|uniref:NADH-quinone oxidoreductase subunit NuoH n=1 Tax=Granulicoccus sp. GXG6511 TaxID=3381351 RepID=UPI003D7E29B4
MSPLFGTDPWWIILIKAAGVLVYLLLFTLFNIVFERKVVAKMQHRVGPIMNGPWGTLQSLADGVKLMVKEDFRPKNAEKFVYNLAPYLVAIPAFSILSMIPLGGEVTMFGVETRLQLTDMPVAVLMLLALASVGIYGIVLAGWSSGSTYSLLGGLRSSAQMISYEIAMGLSFVSVFMYAGSMSTSQIVEAQQQPLNFLGLEIPIPGWYALLLIPAFIVYVISMVGETNRAPFDLPEAESELVGGFHTEYSGFRFAMFFLAEYINMVNVSAIATTLFLGGYHAPWPLNGTFLDQGYWGLLWFTLKVLLFMFLFVWLRGTLPRFRYDQFMGFGWKILIPIALGWILAVATIRNIVTNGFGAVALVSVVLFIAAMVAYLWILDRPGVDEELPDETEDATDEFDPFAGGYPVPPKPGQRLPEFADVVEGETVHETETTGSTTRSDDKGADS